MDHNHESSFLDDLTPAGEKKVDLRFSGIDVIGAVPWGTHFCQFYATSQDLVETLVPYFKAGLEANEFCMWVTSAPLQVDQAMSALRASTPEMDRYIDSCQIEILDYSEWYTPSGHFDADRVLQGWTDKLDAARRRGFDGLRLTGNTFWLEESDWDCFTLYEEKINEVIGGMNMIALCTYSLERCGVREIMDVIANHQFALIKNSGRWEIIESATHKKMEQALRDSEERLRLAIRAADLGVYEWDADQDRAIWGNQRMYEIFGRSVDMGPISKAQFIEDVILPEDAEIFEAALNDGMQTGSLFHVVCRIRRASDSELRWVEFTGRFKHDSQRRPSILSGVLDDITERKQYEVKLREYADQLEDLNRELKDFTSTASHDLKEPLRKISIFGSRLKEQAADRLQQEELDFLERMMGGANRMQLMIDNLLAYSSLSTRESTLVPVDLAQVVTEVLADLETRIEDCCAKVEVGELPVIQADPLQMQQLFQNLISNALKFHDPEKPPLVEVRSEQLPGKKLAIVITDQGIGFSMEYAGKLFQPFQRLVGRSEYEGTGMGLAICRKIVERHKGTITVQSAPDQGTTFTITLPI
jgi:signal transduction histidine kinase